MKKLLPGLIILLLASCSKPPAARKPVKVNIISSTDVIRKYANTAYRKMKLNQGVSGYLDSTFKRDLFVVKDSVSYISTDNKGKPYIILGRDTGHYTVKCYFKNDKTVDSLKLHQIITVSSKLHVAVYKSVKVDSVISILFVEMDKCSLIKPSH